MLPCPGCPVAALQLHLYWPCMPGTSGAARFWPPCSCFVASPTLVPHMPGTSDSALPWLPGAFTRSSLPRALGAELRQPYWSAFRAVACSNAVFLSPKDLLFRILGALAEKHHAYAKALHYREQDFHTRQLLLSTSTWKPRYLPHQLC